MPLPDPLQRAGIGIDVAEALGQLVAAEGRVHPFGEIAAPAPEPVTRLDDVEEDGAHVDPGERVAELPERPRLVSGRNRRGMIL